MADKSEKYPQRTDDQKVLDQTAKDGLGLTVFISDLEDACQKGNPIEMEQEAARLQWVNETGLGGLEVLIEVALQGFDRLGLFAYHLQRANAFQQNKENTWIYTRCLLKEICKASLPEPHDKVEHELWVMDQVSGNISQLNKMAAARRLWEGDYVRIDGYRRELSHWFSLLDEGAEKVDGKKIMNGLGDYVNNGGNFFIQMAEDLQDQSNWEEKTIQLEALRYFIKNATKQGQAVISMHLKELI
jgi:hypothetical protein